jgi:formamidopyrimidine-DNA glycosylase
MPELPEVETIRRDLLERVLGRTITAVDVLPDRVSLVEVPSAEEFARGLVGRRIEGIDRRGKYLSFRLSDGRHWVVHLRMTGALLHRRAGAPPEPYLRAVVALDDGTELRFADMRKFGVMWLVPDPELVVGRLGPEPLNGRFTASRLRELMANRSAPVKSFLMDQRAIAGLGNIYADESLFAAKIHPQRPASSLSEAEVRRLHRAVRRVLRDALGDRGSSFRDYVDADGREGMHQLRVKVYRRAGQPCYVCGREIARITVGGRSSHYCSRCQPRSEP